MTDRKEKKIHNSKRNARLMDWRTGNGSTRDTPYFARTVQYTARHDTGFTNSEMFFAREIIVVIEYR